MQGLLTQEATSPATRLDSREDENAALTTDSFPDFRKAKILIIDDKEPNVLLLERILKRAKYENFISATDSRQAAALFQKFQPDLILTDWLMPHLDGAAVIAQLRALIATDDYLPVVVLTADVTPHTKQRALAAGATDFLTKPFDPLEVLLRIRNLLQARFSHLKIQEHNVSLGESVRLRTVELEKALNELKETQQQVVQQERLAAFGSMASGIAHDFNNSLCAITGFSELLLRGSEQGLTKQAAAGPLAMILTAAKDAAKIVHRLREFCRPSDMDERRSPIQLNKSVEEAINLTAPRWKTQTIAAGKEIFVETDLQEIPPISGQGTELRELLTNLIFNAVDAMPEGGKIALRTWVEGDSVFLQISDTGTGMTAEVRKHCLEPFFTTKGDRGTGLGLAMVFGIVQRHAGTIQLESAPGQGTTFSFRFPACEPRNDATPALTEGFNERAFRILVVEDQPVLRQLLSEYLIDDLHTAETAADGTEALAKFRAGEFDVVLTDQIMTGMNGYELAAELKKLRPEISVILLTGFVQGTEARVDANVDRVLVKPISRAALRSALGRVCAS